MSELPTVALCAPQGMSTLPAPRLCRWTGLHLPSDPHPSWPGPSGAHPCGHHSTPRQVAFSGARTSPGAWTPRGQARGVGPWGPPGHSGGPSSAPCVPVSPQYMEKLSQLAYHPLKMQSCYEKMEPLRLDGLQQRFDVSSTSVFKQRAQIHMREVGPRLLHTAHLPSRVPVSWESAPTLPGPPCEPPCGRSQPRCALSHLFGTPAPLFIGLTWSHLSGLSLETPSSGKPSLLPKPFLPGPRTCLLFS